jgi:putative colanic acid biosynthesis glycosyltransferase WcaI
MARPRLLVLNQYYWPCYEADGRLLTQLCEGLAREWDVSVVTGALPHAGAERVVRNGVETVRVASTAFERSRMGLRAVNYGSFFALALWWSLLSRPPDVVLSYTNPPFVGDVAWAAARRFGAPLIVAVQDVFPETAVALGRLRARPAVAALDATVGFALRRADRVVALGDTMRRRLEEKGVAPERIAVIENWVDPDEIRPEPQVNAWSEARGLAGRFVVMHSGNVGHAQDLDTLVRATALIGEPAVDVVIVGSGVRLGEVRELAEAVAVPVRFLPFQSDGVLSQSLSTAAVHVVGLARGLAGYVVPSRVYGVLAAGRPLIAAAEEISETARLVRKVGCGVVVPPGDPHALAAAVRAARDGQYDLDAMGGRGREYVLREASREAAVSRYLALLEDVRSARKR